MKFNPRITKITKHAQQMVVLLQKAHRSGKS